MNINNSPGLLQSDSHTAIILFLVFVHKFIPSINSITLLWKPKHLVTQYCRSTGNLLRVYMIAFM